MFTKCDFQLTAGVTVSGVYQLFGVDWLATIVKVWILVQLYKLTLCSVEIFSVVKGDLYIEIYSVCVCIYIYIYIYIYILDVFVYILWRQIV